ncbi:MAG: transglycosylase domain-containing protein, partial [Acidimicrobiales bacterium]
NAGEAAFLAGLLRFPNGADPYRGPDALKEAVRRRRVSLERMRAEGYLTAEQTKVFLTVPLDPAVKTDTSFVQPPPRVSTLGQDVKGSEWASQYFVEHVRRWLVAKFGQKAVIGGGLKVYTTLDLGLQKDAYDAVTSTLNQPGDPAAALVAIDDRGQVKAMVGGTDWDKSKLNLATGTSGGGLGRQPGSTFKAFALAEAVRQGYSIQAVLPSPPEIEIPDPACRNKDGSPWKVKGGPGGSSSLVTATKNSINPVYAQLMARLGPAKVIQMAHDLGVQASVPPVCSVVLGAGEVSVLDMAAAYSTFANNGLRKDPVVVTRVEKPDGTVERFAPETHQVLTADQAAKVTFSLRQVIEGGTGAAAAFGRDAAGKTGTTQKNADSWFVGYTPKLTAAVWMGYPQAQIPMDNVHGIKVMGGTFPAEMWRKFMVAATADFDSGTFPAPDPQVLAAGNLIDPNYGRTSVVGPGEGETTTTTSRSSTSSESPTSKSADAATQTTRPRSTVPPSTTAPRTTTPATSSPPTTSPGTPTARPPAGT